MDLGPTGTDGVTDDAVYRCVLKTIVTLGGPSDFGSQPDEHRLRIDNYFPIKSRNARLEGETARDVERRCAGMK